MKISRPKHLLALYILKIGFYSLFTMKPKIMQTDFLCVNSVVQGYLFLLGMEKVSPHFL